MDNHVKAMSAWMKKHNWITVEHGGILYSGTLENLLRVISQKENKDGK